MLQNEYLLAKLSLDTVKDEPSEVFSIRAPKWQFQGVVLSKHRCYSHSKYVQSPAFSLSLSLFAMCSRSLSSFSIRRESLRRFGRVNAIV